MNQIDRKGRGGHPVDEPALELKFGEEKQEIEGSDYCKRGVIVVQMEAHPEPFVSEPEAEH